MDRYDIPKHLDDPDYFGFWTIDEFVIMLIPFIWGIIASHVMIGVGLAFGAWQGYRKIRAGRSMSWILHLFYWHLPGQVFGLRVLPPSHLRTLAG